METGLKPCECGAVPRYLVFNCVRGWMEVHRVDCPKHPVRPAPMVRGITKQNAFEKWNCRFGRGEEQDGKGN